MLLCNIVFVPFNRKHLRYEKVVIFKVQNAIYRFFLPNNSLECEVIFGKHEFLVPSDFNFRKGMFVP